MSLTIAAESPRLSSYVNPFIGTVGAIPGSAYAGGNSFPGASLPWAMAKVGIDTSYIGVHNATDANAGFTPLGNVTAISMTHVSGAGGTPTYGLISQMPVFGNLETVDLANNMTYCQSRVLDRESASVGLFNTTLSDGTEIAITSSNHAGFLRYKFPSPRSASTSNLAGPDDAHVLVDLTHVLPAYFNESAAYSQKFVRGDIHLRSSNTSQPSYFGSATYSGGWSQADSQTLFFCGNFTVPRDSVLKPSNAYVQSAPGNSVSGAGTFSFPVQRPLNFSTRYGTRPTRPVPIAYTDIKTYAGSGMGIGALFSWSPSLFTASNASSVLEAKMGISYISATQACAHIENELPSSKSFEDVVLQSQSIWEDKVLSKIEVVDDGSDSSKNDTLKIMLYSALYQTALQPTDKTGENPYWETNDEKPYYDDFYTLWDTYRTVMPLYHLIFTNTYSRIISGLISIFTNEGYLPAGRAANWNGRVQGGTHADMVLADAFVKSVRTVSGEPGLGELTSIDWQQAYRAMLQNANVPPTRNIDSVAFDGGNKEGRGALDEYLPLHFITRNHTRSISRGLEYSQNDFAVYAVGKGLNKSNSEVSLYYERATWWENQWNPTANTSLPNLGTFIGFPGPRNADRGWNWTDYKPLNCTGGCGWSGDIYEATIWETSFSAAPHDMARVITLMGGDEAFVRRLDASFVPGLGDTGSLGGSNGAGTALYNPGNEPSFMTSFLYNYVPGMQWKTVQQSRGVVNQFYTDRVDGYPGNTDSGALPSWLTFNLLGFYPVAGQPLYLLSAPFFSTIKLHLFDNGSTLTIRANNLSKENIYPQSVKLNGKELDRSWVGHKELVQGGELVFEMGPAKGGWDAGERPWSFSKS